MLAPGASRAPYAKHMMGPGDPVDPQSPKFCLALGEVRSRSWQEALQVTVASNGAIVFDCTTQKVFLLVSCGTLHQTMVGHVACC